MPQTPFCPWRQRNNVLTSENTTHNYWGMDLPTQSGLFPMLSPKSYPVTVPESQLTKTMLMFAKTWDLTVWRLMVSAQCRFAQSVQVRAQSRPQAQERCFYVLNWGKHEQCLSKKYLKNLHQDFIYIQVSFPALPQSICMTLGKSLPGWAADCSEQATVSPKQWQLAFSFSLLHLHCLLWSLSSQSGF